MQCGLVRPAFPWPAESGFLLLESPLDIKAARHKYYNQKRRAKLRGIGWELTFQQWLDWWGADLDNRGSGTSNLQMQRLADTGPYAIGNIRKGVPLDNNRTAGRMLRKRSGEAIVAERSKALMAAPTVEYRSGHGRKPLEKLSIAESYARVTGLRRGWREI
jgi:hypothetical protein